MSGTIPLSMTQQFDVYGKPLAGGQLYIIQAGTVSTPQDAFQDTGLTVKQPYPMTLDAAGRVPQFFLADGTVKVRLQDKNGVVQLASDSVLVIGPSGGGGGGASTVDPTQLIQTGNMIMRYAVGVLAGYVRANSLTIGSATSGATERANADCQGLFQHLWGVDTTLVVSGGRGASALADWSANKQIALPDFRGIVPAGMDDMGAAATGRLTTAYFGADGKILGAGGGLQYHGLTLAELPVGIKSDVPGQTVNVASVIATYASGYNANNGSLPNTGPFYVPYSNVGPLNLGPVNASGLVAAVVATSNNTAGGAHAIVQPTRVLTFYLKL